ncbi:hypothetical protein LOTGIDRAFT_137312 [Lottia gigantea]|uniref:Transmembrane BAX inhibitor motif-containing protein 4 n=1 Tax=Lottia gigantea TaxID=225164 RepID=V4BBV6_LOTGI|nr:hypothetical protein LOTGIDRAFT_137312 [Lottia gigantea]ESP03537.1 hypothetical protein LOTGIDRAFT_137312 [Lottia gigantea]
MDEINLKPGDKSSIVDDFMYGSNVAGAHIYIRMGFLRKVYGILSAQLFLTTVVCAIFMGHEGLRDFIHKSPWMMMVALICTFALLFALMWKRKETPWNYILLGAFTIVESYSIAVVVTMYTVSSVIEAAMLTFGVTAALTMYTFQSKRDFSSWGAGLFAFLWILILAGFLQIFFHTEFMDKMIAIGGAILFSMFIIFDTHLIMHKLSPEEYIMASINLYLDIINLFLHILRLVGQRNN